MSISEICIRRPVFTWVLVGIPVVMGAVAYFDLGVDLFPKVDFPVVSITTDRLRDVMKRLGISWDTPPEK